LGVKDRSFLIIACYIRALARLWINTQKKVLTAFPLVHMGIYVTTGKMNVIDSIDEFFLAYPT
jgi:hypothetical protein